MDTTPEPEVKVGVGGPGWLTALKTLLDLSWKIIPALWIALQFITTSSQTSKKTESNENKIQIIENNLNQLERDLVETRAEIKSLHDQMEMDREFYLQTQQRK